MTSDVQAQLIHEFGALVSGADLTEGNDWQRLALVVRFEDGIRRAYGFYYGADDDGEPLSIGDFAIADKVGELREVMREADGKLWHACLMQLLRATNRFVVTFEYDDGERWHVTPRTLAAVKQAIRPPNNL